MNARRLGTLAGVLILIFAFWRATRARRDEPAPVVTHERAAESPPPTEISPPVDDAPVTAPSSVTPAANPAPTAEETFPTKQEFARSLRHKPFAQWLASARSLDGSNDLADAPLNIGAEVGLFDGRGVETQYRYEVGYQVGGTFQGNSCVGLTLPSGRVVTGVYGEGTLHFAKLEYPNAYLISIRETFFIVRYNDRTESRSFDRERNEPRNPFDVTGLLLLVRGPDGQIIEQGELSRWINAPDAIAYRGPAFCGRTFDAR